MIPVTIKYDRPRQTETFELFEHRFMITILHDHDDYDEDGFFSINEIESESSEDESCLLSF